MRVHGTWIVVALCFAAPALAHAAPGNAWHIPANIEGGATPMRAPLHTIDADDAIVIRSGNQFQGGGNPGNQLQTGSAVIHRAVGDAEWTETQLLYDSTAGNNIYYEGTIAADTYAPGTNLEYYLRVPYSDHDTTYVRGSDGASSVTIDELAAQDQAYVVGVRWPLVPGGPSETIALGDVDVEVFTDSGHVALTGPARDGTADGLQLVLQPVQARFADRWWQSGAVLDTAVDGDDLVVSQVLGERVIDLRIRETAEGIVRVEVEGWDGSAPEATRLEIASPSDEHFYGLGEKFNAVDQTGNQVRVVTADPPGPKGDQSYKVVPWTLSTRGFGLHLDSTAESIFDLRAAEDDRATITNLHGSLAVDVVWGPELTTALTRFTGMVGRPELPPPWVFAPWMSSDHWRTGGEVRYVVERLVAENIPTSVFVFDSPWETAYNDFTWNEAQFAQGGTYDGVEYDGFADAAEMMAFLRSRGIKVVVWLTPFINVQSNDEGVPGQNTGQASNYAEAAAAGYFVRDGAGGPPLLVDWWKGTGSPVDFTNPAAREWFRAQLEALVADSDGVIAGFKIDDGEGTYIPLTASYSDGRTGVEMKNGYTVEYHATVGEILGDDGILFSRSGFTGTGAYPAGWAGDNEPNFGEENGLPSVIVAGMSAALSGWSIWAHDVGGYQDTNLSSTPENLFMRWAQLGAFTPIMQMHRQVALELQYPWSFGADGLANYRTYAQLHTELFPYVYSHARVAAETGLPILRPLVLVHPDDPEVWPVRHTFLFGDALLVAPMIENEQTERTVYLPAGTWLDWWTRAPIEGGAYYDWVETDQQRLPLFVRRGAIVPRLAAPVQTLVPADEIGNPEIATPDGAWSVLVVVDPGAPSELVAYDDTRFTVEPSPEVITITQDGPGRRTRFEVTAESPLGVTVGGALAPEVADVAALADVDLGWTFAEGAVWVQHEHPGNVVTLVLHYDELPSTTGADGSESGATDGEATQDDGASSATLDTSGATNDNTGDGGADGSGGGGGCGCETNGPPSITLGAPMALLAFGRRSRRRKGQGQDDDLDQVGPRARPRSDALHGRLARTLVRW